MAIQSKILQRSLKDIQASLKTPSATGDINIGKQTQDFLDSHPQLRRNPDGLETPRTTKAKVEVESKQKAAEEAAAGAKTGADAKPAAETKVPNGDQGVAEAAENASEDASWWQRNKKVVAGAGGGVVASTVVLSGIASMVMSGGERTNSNLYSPSQATY